MQTSAFRYRTLEKHPLLNHHWGEKRIPLLVLISMKLLTILVILLLASTSVWADDYVAPSYPNLLRTLIRFKALDVRDDNLLDEYALVTDCDVYDAYYADDFKWNKVRGIVRESIRLNVPTFPTAYTYTSKIKLGRYDFKKQVYPFASQGALRNVNAIEIYSTDGNNLCKKHGVKYLPTVFRIVLETSIYLDGLPLSPGDAQTLTERMEKAGNTDRLLFVKFNMNVTYIEPLVKNLRNDTANPVSYSQGGKDNTSSGVRLDARLASINFYEDEAMPRLVYSYSF